MTERELDGGVRVCRILDELEDAETARWGVEG